MKRVLVSVITVVFNAGPGIKNTIDSVLALKTAELEYIIIDGDSDDGTLDILDEYRDRVSVIISEPDCGIYDAMNKGVSMATGEFVLFINNGDILIHMPFDRLKDIVADLVCFPIITHVDKLILPKVSWELKIRNTLPHQGCFYKRKLVKYNTAYKVFADFDMNQNIYMQGKTIICNNTPPIAFHAIDGISHNRKCFHEVFNIVSANYGFIYKCISFVRFKIEGLKIKFRF